MLGLLNKASYLRWYFTSLPQHSNGQIAGNTNRVLHWANCDLSYGSIFSSKVQSIFFRQVICLWGLNNFNMLGHNSGFSSQCIVLPYIRIVKDAQLGNNKGLTPLGHINESNPVVPYCWTTCCRTARLNSILQFQVTLFGVSYQAPGSVLLQSTHQHLAPWAPPKS